MKLSLPISIASCILIPLTTLAQTWNEQEQELLDQLETCWDAWMEAVEQNNPELWIEKCNPAKNYSMWWTEEGAPQGIDAVKRDWETIRKVDVRWIDIRPVAIRIFDNVGIVQFYGYWKANTETGPVTTEYKRTEVFLKVDGKWSFIGGQGTPVSSADSEPYS